MTLGLTYQVDEHIKYINNNDDDDDDDDDGDDDGDDDDDDDDVENENRNSTSCYRAHQEGTGKRHGKNP